MTVTSPERTRVKHGFDAMGTKVSMMLAGQVSARDACDRVERLFERVERSCSRFDPSSDLMRANARSSEASAVAPECLAIVAAALDAHRRSSGLFDPRVLSDLVSAGYDRSFDEIPVRDGDDSIKGIPHRREPWRPAIDPAAASITIGEDPIDLGGIGKGWSVDAAAAVLSEETSSFLVNAGGDLVVMGDGPSGDGWTVALEEPRDPTVTLAVLRVRDVACATSSTGRRRWQVGMDQRHHLIDPRTGRPAAGGLQSVTVVSDSTVVAETWSKSLLIAGADEITALCTRHGLAALAVLDDGSLWSSDEMQPLITWQRAHA
jgi:thiamine biosynthesis lipoprotein